MSILDKLFATAPRKPVLVADPAKETHAPEPPRDRPERQPSYAPASSIPTPSEFKAQQEQARIDKLPPPVAPPAPPPLKFMTVDPGILVALRKRGPDGFLDDLIAEGRKLQAIYSAREAELMAHCGDNAQKAFIAQQSAMEKSLAAGEPLPADVWSVEDFREDFQHRRTVLKNALRAISGQSIPLVAECARRLAIVAGEAAAEIESAEERLYKPWSAAPMPSRLLTLLRYVRDHHAHLFSASGNQSPQTNFDALQIQL